MKLDSKTKISLSTHVVKRYKERININANNEEIEKYVRRSSIITPEKVNLKGKSRRKDYFNTHTVLLNKEQNVVFILAQISSGHFKVVTVLKYES